MKKILSLFVALGLCFSLVGCSTQDHETTKKSNIKDEKIDLKISENGYSMIGNYLYYGIKIHNPNKKYTINFPTYTVTAYAEDGSIITTEDQVLNYIAPKKDILWSGLLDCKGQTPSKVEFTTKKDEDNYSTNVIDKNSLLSVENTSVINDGYYTSFTGIVKNNSKEKFNNVAIILILRKENKIICGEMTFIDNIQEEQSSPFEISNSQFDEINYDTYEIYAYDWSY